MRFEAAEGTNADFALHTSLQLSELLDAIRKACGLIATLFLKYSDTESITELSQFANLLQNSISTAPKCAQIRGRCLAAKEIGIAELLLELVRLREPGEIIKEALEAMKSDEIVHKTLGSHIFDAFIDYKTNDWNQYCLYVTPWEIMKYLDY